MKSRKADAPTLTLAEFAAKVGRHRNTVARMLERGEIAGAYRTSGTTRGRGKGTRRGHWRIPVDAVIPEWLLPAKPGAPKMISVAEFAKRVGCHPNSVYAAIRRGEVKGAVRLPVAPPAPRVPPNG